MINEKCAKSYCSEDISKIENYEQAISDDTQGWDCHHRLEIQGQFRNSTSLLKKCCLYYNVPAWQLIFLPHGEHTRLHTLGGHLSEETRKKLSIVHSGEKHPMFGKRHSEETRKKMSLAHSGEKHPMFGKRHSEETRKKMSISHSGEKNYAFGRKWFTNGVDEIFRYECPPGFAPGRAKNKKKTR